MRKDGRSLGAITEALALGWAGLERCWEASWGTDA